MRDHDPALCDYMVVEERMEWGRSVVRSTQMTLTAPAASEEFDDDDMPTDPGRHTIIGLLGTERRPAAPASEHANPVCKTCGAPYVDELTPADQIPPVWCDGRCELDVEL